MIGGFRAETDKRGSEGYWEQPRGPVARQKEEPDASSYPGAVSVAFREKKKMRVLFSRPISSLLITPKGKPEDRTCVCHLNLL